MDKVSNMNPVFFPHSRFLTILFVYWYHSIHHFPLFPNYYIVPAICLRYFWWVSDLFREVEGKLRFFFSSLDLINWNKQEGPQGMKEGECLGWGGGLWQHYKEKHLLIQKIFTFRRRVNKHVANNTVSGLFLFFNSWHVRISLTWFRDVIKSCNCSILLI